MKIKNFLLGVSLAMCGAAFGQADPYAGKTGVYLPDENKTYFAESVSINEDADGESTTITLNNMVGVENGNLGDSNPTEYPIFGRRVFAGTDDSGGFHIFCIRGLLCAMVHVRGSSTD